MFMFVDGRPVVLSFALVEGLYYKAFMDKFPDAQVSLTQWRGSYEYQAIYPDIQMIVETGVITRDAMAYIGQSIVQANEAIQRPACLYSRVPERFAEAGYEASIRIATEATKGTVAICVGQERIESLRTMVIGQNADEPNIFGFNHAEGLGALDLRVMSGGQLIEHITTSTDGANNNTYLRFDKEVNDANGLVFTFTGHFSGGFTFASDSTDPNPSTLWVCTDPALSTNLRASLGESVQFSIAEHPATKAVSGDDEVIGNLIRDEMLPAGQWMEGNVIYDTALSNQEPITIRWTTPTEWDLPFRLTIVRRKGSPHPENTVDEIIEKFLTNFNAVQGIGKDVYPATYLTTADLPWAASILAEWTDSGETAWWSDDIDAAYNVKYTASVQPARVVIV